MARVHESLPPNGRIIEYASGPALTAASLLERDPGREIETIDKDPRANLLALQLLREASHGRPTRTSRVNADLLLHPYRENDADGALMISAFHPLEDQVMTHALERIYRELLPGRRAIISEPRPGVPLVKMEALANEGIGRGIPFSPEEVSLAARATPVLAPHHRRTMTGLERLAHKAGFRVLDRSRDFYDRNHTLLLEKPTPAGLEDDPSPYRLAKTQVGHFIASVTPRRGEFRFESQSRRHYPRLALHELLTPRYGLLSPSYMNSGVGDFHRHNVVTVIDERDSSIAGVARSIPFYSIDYPGIDPEVLRAWKSRRIDSISIYYGDRVVGTLREAYVWKAAWESMRRLGRLYGVQGFYGEARPGHVKIFERQGFETIGTEFQVPGWSGSYVPLLFDLRKERP
jgi:hypothetical protein